MKSNNIFIDYLVYVFVLVLTGAAFYVTYNMPLSGPIIAIVWIVWSLASVGVFYFSTPGQSAFEFAKQAKTELLKVTWPSRQETVQTTTIVVIMVCISGFLLWLADSAMMWIIGKITHLG